MPYWAPNRLRHTRATEVRKQFGLEWNKALETDLKLVPEDLDFKKPYPVAPVPAPGMMA